MGTLSGRLHQVPKLRETSAPAPQPMPLMRRTSFTSAMESMESERAVILETTQLALRRYARSYWPLVALALILGIFLVCFRFPFGAAYFFDISTFGVGAVTTLTTYTLVHSVFPPRSYLRLGLRTSLRGTFGGLALAAAAIGVSLVLVMLLLAVITGRFAGTTPGAVIVGTIGLLANCLLISTVTIALSAPGTTPIVRRVVLLWLVLAFASYQASGLLAILLFPAKLLLLPVAASYDFGVTGSIGWGGLLALVVQAAYIAGLIWFMTASLKNHHHHSHRASGSSEAQV
jgi:hypothetical protein